MIKVKLNKYHLDVTDSDDAKTYSSIQKEALGLGYKLFDFIAMGIESKLDDMPEDQTIETNFLFQDQYNTVEGFRIHDWSETIYHNKSIKKGYYLTGDIDLLKTAKDNQYACGYCGARYNGAATPHFCNKCLDSEYLTEDNFHLLRLLPISSTEDRPQLSDIESIPIKTAFLEGRKKFKLKQLERLKAKANKVLDDANKQCARVVYEAKAKAAFYTIGYDPSNLIYYDHTNEWCLGWRNPISEDEKSEFLEACDLAKELLPIDKNGIELTNLLKFKYN